MHFDGGNASVIKRQTINEFSSSYIDIKDLRGSVHSFNNTSQIGGKSLKSFLNKDGSLVQHQSDFFDINNSK